MPEINFTCMTDFCALNFDKFDLWLRNSSGVALQCVFSDVWLVRTFSLRVMSVCGTCSRVCAPSLLVVIWWMGSAMSVEHRLTSTFSSDSASSHWRLVYCDCVMMLGLGWHFFPAVTHDSLIWSRGALWPHIWPAGRQRAATANSLPRTLCVGEFRFTHQSSRTYEQMRCTVVWDTVSTMWFYFFKEHVLLIWKM